jgi:hypothetical protein
MVNGDGTLSQKSGNGKVHNFRAGDTCRDIKILVADSGWLEPSSRIRNPLVASR